MVLTALVLLIITLVVVRFRPDAAVWAANSLLEDTHIDAETIQLGYFPPKLEVSQATVQQPDQNIALTSLAANMDVTAWWSSAAFWSLTADKITLDVSSQPSQSGTPTDTPLNLAIPDLAPLLSFSQLGISELEILGDSALRATLLAERKSTDTHIEATLTQAGESYTLTGTVGHQPSGSMPFSFNVNGVPATGDVAPADALTVDLQIQGSLQQQDATRLTVTDGTARLNSNEVLINIINIKGLVEISKAGDTLQLSDLSTLVSHSASAITDLPATLNAQVSLGTERISVTGDGALDQVRVEWQLAVANATGDLDGHIDLSSTGLPAGMDHAPFTADQLFPASFSSDIRMVDSEISLANMKLETPRNALSGNASVSTAAPWRLIADLGSSHLYFPLISETPEIEPEALGRTTVDDKTAGEETAATETANELLFSATPIDWSWLTSAEIDAKLVADKLALQDAEFTDLKITLQNNNGRLTLDPLSANLGDGGFSGRANIDLQPGEEGLAPIQLTAGFEMSGVSLEAFGLVPTEELSGGKVEANINLSALGNSQSELASSLDGEILLMIEEAVLMNDFIELVGSDLVMETLNKLNPFAKEDPTTQLSCALVRFTAEDGKLSTKRQLVMETSKMEIIGDGNINLNDETISLGITPDAKSGVGINIGSAVKFMKLGGTLSSPRPAVSAGGLLKSGLAIGAAISTGGASVVAEGLAKRALNAGSACEAARSETSEES